MAADCAGDYCRPDHEAPRRIGAGLHESVPVIRGLLDLTHVRNTGAAFGFLNTADFPVKPVVIAVVAFGALLGVALYARQLPAANWLARLGLALILGGAAGNLIDRVRRDTWSISWTSTGGDWHFWAFNVADSAISVGVAHHHSRHAAAGAGRAMPIRTRERVVQCFLSSSPRPGHRLHLRRAAGRRLPARAEARHDPRAGARAGRARGCSTSASTSSSARSSARSCCC